MDTGGASCTPLLIHTGLELPSVPDTVIIASCWKVSIEAIQKAVFSEEGSIRANIAARLSGRIVLAPCPDTADAMTAAGQLTNPSGSPAPEPVMNAASSRSEEHTSELQSRVD